MCLCRGYVYDITVPINVNCNVFIVFWPKVTKFIFYDHALVRHSMFFPANDRLQYMKNDKPRSALFIDCLPVSLLRINCVCIIISRDVIVAYFLYLMSYNYKLFMLIRLFSKFNLTYYLF